MELGYKSSFGWNKDLQSSNCTLPLYRRCSCEDVLKFLSLHPPLQSWILYNSSQGCENTILRSFIYTRSPHACDLHGIRTSHFVSSICRATPEDRAPVVVTTVRRCSPIQPSSTNTSRRFMLPPRPTPPRLPLPDVMHVRNAERTSRRPADSSNTSTSTTASNPSNARSAYIIYKIY